MARVHRRLATALIVLLALLVSGGWVWYFQLPGQRPRLSADETYGIDVSMHQGPIDWNLVAGDGIEFAYVKATEGGDFKDPRFAANWSGAAAVGIQRGAYHFFTLCRSGADQAANFLSVIEADPGSLPPAVDLELAGNCTRRPSRDEFAHELVEFATTVEATTGSHLIVYVLEDFDQAYGVRSLLPRPFWIRHLITRPPAGDWAIWQVNPQARVAGIATPVDLDVRAPLPADRRKRD